MANSSAVGAGWLALRHQRLDHDRDDQLRGHQERPVPRPVHLAVSPDQPDLRDLCRRGGSTFSAWRWMPRGVSSRGRTAAARGDVLPAGELRREGLGQARSLTNPFAFGYFEHMKHQGDGDRFPQTFSIYEERTTCRRSTAAISSRPTRHAQPRVGERAASGYVDLQDRVDLPADRDDAGPLVPAGRYQARAGRRGLPRRLVRHAALARRSPGQLAQGRAAGFIGIQGTDGRPPRTKSRSRRSTCRRSRMRELIALFDTSEPLGSR